MRNRELVAQSIIGDVLDELLSQRRPASSPFVFNPEVREVEPLCRTMAYIRGVFGV